jgi:hypothetical protein
MQYFLLSGPPPGTPTVGGWQSSSMTNIGDTLTLTCNAAVSGGTTTSYEWYQGLIKLDSTGNMGELYSKVITVLDAGEYRCLAINNEGYAASMTYNLTVKSKFSWTF